MEGDELDVARNIAERDDDADAQPAPAGPATRRVRRQSLLAASRAVATRPTSNSRKRSEPRADGPTRRVAAHYLAVVPPFDPTSQRPRGQCVEKVSSVWIPNDKISEAELDGFLDLAQKKHKFNAEQALGLLLWCRHDLKRARKELGGFSPKVDSWSGEDTVLFLAAVAHYKKDFYSMRELLPDKTTGDLVRFYYRWKNRTRGISSVLDARQKRLLAVRQGLVNGESVDLDEPEEDEKRRCAICGVTCDRTGRTKFGEACGTCHNYTTTRGVPRPLPHPPRLKACPKSQKDKVLRSVRRPPKGIIINHDDLVPMVRTQHPSFVKVDNAIAELKRKVQENKQILEDLRRKKDALAFPFQEIVIPD